jgi:hypothetical protein
MRFGEADFNKKIIYYKPVLEQLLEQVQRTYTRDEELEDKNAILNLIEKVINK